MARFCHFWHLSPRDFWDLDIHEYFAMLRFMRKHEQHQETVRSGRSRLRR